MDRLLSFLVFAAFFYLMMRFGCGAHMVHGNHGGHGHEGNQGADKGSAKDPVCGMPVDPARVIPSTFKGRNFASAPNNAWTSSSLSLAATRHREETA